jgi:hypothetical protein
MHSNVLAKRLLRNMLKVYCINAIHGCKEQLECEDSVVTAHELACPFTPLQCCCHKIVLRQDAVAHV